jgi:hypothetical protein
MLSRRNVRIKVMQVLYAFNRENANPQLALRHYQKMVDDAYQLYLYNLLVLIRVAEYARQDERASLPLDSARGQGATLRGSLFARPRPIGTCLAPYSRHPSTSLGRDPRKLPGRPPTQEAGAQHRPIGSLEGSDPCLRAAP